MLHARQDLAFGGSIALQFISDDHVWDVLESYAELPKKAFCRVCVPSALDEDIQHVAVLIDGSPQIMPLATDREKDLVQVPLIPTPRAAAAEFVCVRLPKRASTTGARFRRSRRSRAGRRPLFDIAKTEREAEIQPNSMADNLRWEAKAFVIGGSGVYFHEAILTHCSATF
jgi:hypothetical protein